MADNIKTVLVELDSLLDTRLATIESIDPIVAKTLFNNPAYFTRQWDDWSTLTHGCIDEERFQKAYEQRDIDTLKRARPTRIVKLIKEITTHLDNQRHVLPDVSGVELIVNIYPYSLNHEAQEVLKTLVYSYCHFMTVVKTIRRPYEQLTPLAMKNHWDGVILYDFDQWFQHHGKSLNTVLIPRNQLVVPKRYLRSPAPLEKEYEAEVKEDYPFDILALACIERIELVMLDLKEFSIFAP